MVLLHQPLLQLDRARAELVVGGQHHGQDEGNHGAPAVEELLFRNRGQEGTAVELDLVICQEPGGSHAGTVTTGRSSCEGVLDFGFEVRRTGGVGARSIEPDSFLRRGVQDGPVRPHAPPLTDAMRSWRELRSSAIFTPR